MKRKTFLDLLLILLLLSLPALNALSAITPIDADGGKLVGKVVESPNNIGVSFATIALLTVKDSAVVQGSIADLDGIFTVPNVKPGNYILRITNLGYKTLYVPGVRVATEANLVDLGTITITSEAQKLSEVVITAEKSMIVDDIDKKIVSIGQDMLSASNNVSDLLEKLPAVSLDENGNPQLRGKGNVVVLIDGKPSNLYGSDLPTILQSFPANLIERIEVMTTPSAKYEGEGASGVIDIITKKVKIRGTNGGVRLSLGNTNTHAGSANVNYKAGKFGLNSSVSGQMGDKYWERTLDRENFVSETPTFLRQDGSGGNSNKNAFGRIGMNYDFNEKNTIEIGANYSRNSNGSNSDLLNRTTFENGMVKEEFTRINKGNGNGGNMNFSFDYRKKFDKKDQLFSFTANYSKGTSDGESFFDQESNIDSLDRHQQNLRNNNRSSIFLNTDYTWPITKKATLEVGVRSRFNSNDNTNAFYSLNTENNEFEFNPRLSNIFAYQDETYTGFVTFSQKTEKWGIRTGLRLTDYNQDINQVSSNREFGIHFLTLVPSLAITRKLNDVSQIKLNYSRRVQRPEADWLNPFTDLSDPRNVQTGNPNLRPEFTHKAELGYSSYETNGGWGPSLFMDYSDNAITRIRTIDENGTSLSRYDNVGKEMAYGLETDFNSTLWEILKINGSGRIFRSEVVSRMAQIDNRAWSYSGNLNAFIKLPMDFRASAYVNYEGPRAIAQGTRDGVFIANMGIRKDLMEKKATVSFNVQDVFLSRTYKSQLNTATYSQNSLWHQTNRLINVSFNYRFGKISTSSSSGA